MFTEFEVTPAVLIPRPETEALTEAALNVLGKPAGEIRVADIGTGSGVIATTIALKVPSAVVYATDVSAAALEVAARNAERAGVAPRVRFLSGNLLEPLRREKLEGSLTALVSNPPYVATGDIASLPAEVRDFEPMTALDGGPDGLDSLRAIAQDGPEFLAPGGAVLLEVGDGQAPAVEGMLRAALGNARTFKDYAGRDRIVTAVKEDAPHR